MRVLAASFCIVACLLGATTVPAATPAPLPDCLTDDERALARRLDECVAGLVARLYDKDDPHTARLAVLQLHETFATALMNHAVDAAAPAEGRARAVDTLSQAARRARESAAMVLLTPAQRENLREFRRLYPHLFNLGVCESFTQRADTIAALAKLDVPQSLAEPLLIVALKSPHPEPILAALDVIARKNYRSDELEDVIAAVAAADLNRDMESGNQSLLYHNSWIPRDRTQPSRIPAVEAARQLRAWNATRVTPRLLDALRRSRFNDDNLADLLADLRDPRCVPALVTMLESAFTTPDVEWRVDENSTYTRAASDAVLHLLLRLTRQSTEAYRMILYDPPSSNRERLVVLRGLDDDRIGFGNTRYGFEQGPDREAAIAKFNQWYAQNKDRYADAAPMEFPPPRVAVTPPWPYTAAKDEATAASAPDLAELRNELADAVAAIAPDLSAGSPATRARAQERLLALHDRLTAPLIDDGRPGNIDESAAAGRFLLQHMAALSEGLAYAATLDKPRREKLLRFASRKTTVGRDTNDNRVTVIRRVAIVSSAGANWVSHTNWDNCLRDIDGKTGDQLFRDFFMREEHRQERLLHALSFLHVDREGDAEELVVLGLSSRTPEIHRLACQAAASGHYRDERVVELLCKQLAVANEHNWQSHVLKALELLGPRARPATPLLLSRFPDGWKMVGRVNDNRTTFFDTLAAIQDERLIPVLVERLGKNQYPQFQKTYDGIVITYNQDDHALYILLRLTKQSPLDYGLQPPGYVAGLGGNVERTLGFDAADPKARDAAYEKMRQWWQEHKDQPPYNDIVSLPAE